MKVPTIPVAQPEAAQEHIHQEDVRSIPHSQSHVNESTEVMIPINIYQCDVYMLTN